MKFITEVKIIIAVGIALLIGFSVDKPPVEKCNPDMCIKEGEVKEIAVRIHYDDL